MNIRLNRFTLGLHMLHSIVEYRTVIYLNKGRLVHV